MQRIRNRELGFEYIYPEGFKVVRCISDYYKSILQFEFASGEIRRFPFPKWFDHGYNFQFGVSVTPNGERFFAQSWEKGLFCYCLKPASFFGSLKGSTQVI